MPFAKFGMMKYSHDARAQGDALLRCHHVRLIAIMACVEEERKKERGVSGLAGSGSAELTSRMIWTSLTGG
jgi:hypothetical protein